MRRVYNAPIAAASGGRETIADGWRIGPPLAPAGGGQVLGADLSAPVSPALREAIVAALLRCHVVVFPAQTLTREQQFAFAANFGAVAPPRGAHQRHGVAHVISNLDEAGNPVARSSPAGNDHWHTDKPYNPIPPALTMLHAVELPPEGGDTEFANTVLAYDALPDAVKNRIAGLRVIFSPKFVTDPTQQTAVDHPLVRTHPETGRKALYLGNHAVGIVGMAPGESAALLGALLEHATQRRFVYTHCWRVGDLLMWDNRCLLHRAVPNFDRTRHRRILHRSIVGGTVPV